MAKHAILGASSSKRWLNCAGSVRMTANLESGPSSQYAELGTAAHTLGEWCLEKMVDPREFKGEIITTDEGNSFVVDDEMIDAVRVYFELIRDEARENGISPEDIQLEKRFDLSWLHQGMFGTNDASFSVAFGDLYIYDYKHGAGVSVDAIDNTQLVYYAIGAAYNVEFGDWEDFENVHMTIVQPRAYHVDGPVRRWTISMEELKEWAKILKAGAIKTEAKDAPLSASEDSCRWCAAASFCPAIKDKAMEVAKVMFEPLVPKAETLITKFSIEDCVTIVNHKKLLETLVKECEYRLEEEVLRKGKKVEGMKIVRGRGSRDWVDKTEAQRVLSQSFTMNQIMKMDLKTPAQLEKIVGKNIIKDLVVKKLGVLKVAPSSDKRKEVDPQDAKELFKPVEQGD